MSSLHPQGCAQGAAPELAHEMIPRLSVHPSICAQTAGLEQGGPFPGLAATFRDGKAGGAWQSPVPSVGTSGELCRRAVAPRLQDRVFVSFFIFHPDA